MVGGSGDENGLSAADGVGGVCGDHEGDPWSYTVEGSNPALVAAALALVVAAYLLYNVDFVQFQGRYLYPALIPLAGVVAATLPACRARLRWRLPAFREASLAQLASAIALMLKNGATLPEALALAEALESHTPAAAPLARWRRRLEAGQGKPADWDAENRPFPPLFLWLVQRSGEDVAAGFQQAADLYRARASYRIEMMLYGALPVAIVLLGLMVLWQAAPGVIWLTRLGDFLYLVGSF